MESVIGPGRSEAPCEQAARVRGHLLPIAYGRAAHVHSIDVRAAGPEAAPRAEIGDAVTQREKAFAALDALPGSKYLPFGALVKRLTHFGHADGWAMDMAREWYRANSKLFSGTARVAEGKSLNGLPEAAAPVPVEEEGPLFAEPTPRRSRIILPQPCCDGLAIHDYCESCLTLLVTEIPCECDLDYLCDHCFADRLLDDMKKSREESK